VLRADVLESRERILAAAEALAGNRQVSMVELAAAAGVGRSTTTARAPLSRSRPPECAHEMGLSKLRAQASIATSRATVR